MPAPRTTPHDPSARGPDPGAPSPSRRRGVRAILAAGFALAVLAVAAPAASAAPWACDGTGYVTMYGGTVGQNTLFSRVARQPDGTYTVAPIHTEAGALINAVGFRPQDGFMYAWRNQPAPPGLVRIEDDAAGGATFSPLPAVVGMPAGFGAFVGAFLADGTYFVFGTPANPVGYIIDVSGPVPSVITQVTPTWDASGTGLPLGDVAVSPVDGKLYSNVSGQTRELILSGSTISLGPVVGTGGPTSGGAQWFSPAGTQATLLQIDGHLTLGGTHLWATDMATGVGTDLGALDQTIPNGDGTSCANTLAVTKDASPRTVTAGGELTYAYTITARGLVDNPVDFVDQLPAGMTYVPGGVTVNGTFGPTNAYAGIDTLSISGTIPRNTTVTVTARVSVAPTAACNVDVPNQAQATMHAAGLPDVTIGSDDPTTLTDPTDPTTVHVNCPPPPPPTRFSVTLTKTVSDSTVTVGDTVTYTMVARNNGPDAAPDRVVTDTLPSRLDARSASSTQGICTVTDNDVRCAIGTLAAGQAVTITVRAVAIRAGDAINGAHINDCTAPPPCATVPVKIVKPRLKLTKVVSRKTLRPGQTATYKIRVRNPSERVLRKVKVCDDLPSGLAFVKATPKAKLSKGKYCWPAKRLGAGKSKTYRMTVRALQGTSGRKVNTATATSPDARTKRAKRAVRVIGGQVLPRFTG
jgi:uncharacterized repeat protein (TIGR01451 family)